MAEIILPERFRTAKWTNQVNPDMKKLMLEYTINHEKYFSKGLAPMFLGKSGIGKSYNAAIITMELSQMDVNCGWVPVVQKLNHILDLRDYRKDSYFKQKSLLYETGFLVLDDFGQLRDFPRIRELFFDIVDYRYSWKLPTMFTANFEGDSREELERDVAKCFNAALARRIFAMSEGLVYCG